jgi:hypothetical protein
MRIIQRFVRGADEGAILARVAVRCFLETHHGHPDSLINAHKRVKRFSFQTKFPNQSRWWAKLFHSEAYHEWRESWKDLCFKGLLRDIKRIFTRADFAAKLRLFEAAFPAHHRQHRALQRP